MVQKVLVITVICCRFTIEVYRLFDAFLILGHCSMVQKQDFWGYYYNIGALFNRALILFYTHSEHLHTFRTYVLIPINISDTILRKFNCPIVNNIPTCPIPDDEVVWVGATFDYTSLALTAYCIYLIWGIIYPLHYAHNCAIFLY